MRRLAHTIVLSGLALLLANCQTPEIRKAMVQFDQAFLPVLLYSYEGDTYQAKHAVFFLEFRWQQLRKQYEGMLPEERETFQRINDWLGDAYYAIDANYPQVAANQLEHVKYELADLRDRYGVDYYLDGLYDFEGSLSLLREAANDEMLCFMEWSEYEQLLRETRRSWEKLCAEPFDAALFGFDAQKQSRLREEQQAMAEALGRFAETVSCADRLEMARSSNALQPAFLKVLKLFGAFEVSQAHFAQRL